MSKNAKSYKLNRENFLIFGSPGSGKTSMFTTIPGRKFMYIFDPNVLDSIAGTDVDYEEFIPQDLNLDVIPLSKKLQRDRITDKVEPLTYIRWEEHFAEFRESGEIDKYDVIGFDSMTSFQSIMMDRVQYMQGQLGKHPEQADYTVTAQCVTNAFRTITALNKRIYTTAHIEFREESKNSSKMINRASLIGSLRNQMPTLFSDIWLCFADHDEDKQRYRIQTQQDRYNPYLRASRQFRGLAFEEDVTIEDFNNPEEYGIGALLRKVGSID